MNSATNHTIAYIKHLAQDLIGCDPDCAVLAMLYELKIPVHFDGFEYLKAAIILQREEHTRDLVNDIYQMLADRYGANPEMIATAIRSVISAGWKRSEPEIWFRYLPTLSGKKNGAPTNAEVISGLARNLELWQGCANAYLRQLRMEVVSSGRK